MQKVFVYDSTLKDKQSSVRGIGRYLQILRENFAGEFEFVPKIRNWKLEIKNSVFINPFFNFLQPPLTLKRLAHKQIAVIHDLIPLKYPRHFPPGIKGSIYILLNKLTLKNYDVIITDSEASKKDIVEILKIKNQKVKIIYPCLPKNFLNNKTTPYNLPATPYCLYVGDATWNKNLVNIVYAIKIANVNCVFVGKVFGQLKVASEEERREQLNLSHPWQKELKEFYKLTKDDKRFIFTGFIPDSELIKLYEQASVNLLLSRAEGFGFSYLEAANFSCPSLLSDIPVLREISDGKALFADPNNYQDIAEKINKIYLNKALKNRIGTAAKKRSEFFSTEKFKKEFLSIL